MPVSISNLAMYINTHGSELYMWPRYSRIIQNYDDYLEYFTHNNGFSKPLSEH